MNITHATHTLLPRNIMLIRITNKCTMGCSHCLIESSSPDGEHMSLEKFDEALRVTHLLHSRVVVISGGEPFEHPDIFSIIAETKNREFVTIVTSNGLFALDPEKRRMAKASGANIQITNDPRFYPRKLDLVQHLFEHKNWSFTNHVPTIISCRRTREAGIKPNRKAPSCFNIRSLAREYDIISAVSILEFKGRFCTPSIDADGSIRAGESDTCVKIGEIEYSTEDELNETLRTMICRKCGLVNNLDDAHLKAIGETPLSKNK